MTGNRIRQPIILRCVNNGEIKNVRIKLEIDMASYFFNVSFLVGHQARIHMPQGWSLRLFLFYINLFFR